MAAITAAQAGNFSATATWNGGVVPIAGNTANPNGFAVVIDAEVTCDGLVSTENVGYFSLASGSQTINAPVTYGGTNTSGFIRVSGGTLTITGPGSGTLIANTSGGYAIVASGSSSLVLSNAGGKAILNSGTGRGLSWGSSGTGTITGEVECSTTYGTALRTTAGTVTVNGNVITSGACLGLGWEVAGGSHVLNGLPITAQTSGAGTSAPVRLSSGSTTLTWTGARTLAAATSYFVHVSSGTTLDLTNLAVANSGNLCIWSTGGTITKTGASIVNQSSAATATILGDGAVSIIRTLARKRQGALR